MPFSVAHRTGVKERLPGLLEGWDGKGTVSQWHYSSSLGMVEDACICICLDSYSHNSVTCVSVSLSVSAWMYIDFTISCTYLYLCPPWLISASQTALCLRLLCHLLAADLAQIFHPARGSLSARSQRLQYSVQAKPHPASPSVIRKVYFLSRQKPPRRVGLALSLAS